MGGNSDTLLSAALAGAEEAGAEIKRINVSGLRISGCTECNDCYALGECSITDDDMGQIYDALEWADRIIFASPIFFMGLPSQAKALIDRCQRYWALKHVLGEEFPRPEGAPARFGIFIGVGATRGKKLFDGVILTMKYFFDAISMKPVEDLYVLIRGIDEKGEISTNAEALRSARESGGKLAAMD
ncbi:MAG: flavodoxin family protein [Thermoleophilia bacterium]|nr:flavodoxin family protein [Thermoleophilia bacterium]